MLFQKRRTIDLDDPIQALKDAMDNAEVIVIGAGAGLSTSAGFIYSGERFRKYFADFEKKYGFHDMYSGGFYPYETLEEYWAYWSRYIYINRYLDAPKPVYEKLLELVKDRNYFVLTTNVDHCFQKAGFDKERLFYTQGDYGLWQCSRPCHESTYENEVQVKKMVEAQGYTIAKDGSLAAPSDGKLLTKIPTELVPRCPICHRPMTMNLRADSTFVEDNGWHLAVERYEQFLQENKKKRIVFLELGVGYNTPGIIKYPFWQMTAANPQATYACLNLKDAAAPKEIARQAICVEGDMGETLENLFDCEKADFASKKELTFLCS